MTSDPTANVTIDCSSPRLSPGRRGFLCAVRVPASACHIDHHRTEILRTLLLLRVCCRPGFIRAFLSSRRITNGSYPQSSVCRRYFCASALVPAIQSMAVLKGSNICVLTVETPESDTTYGYCCQRENCDGLDRINRDGLRIVAT